MLRSSLLAGVNHLMLYVIVHKDPDNTVLRDDRVDPVPDSLVSFFCENRSGESGSVIIPDICDSVLNLLSAEGGCINGEITSLAVATDHDRHIHLQKVVHVLYCLPLSGGSDQVGEFKIFLPADNRIIGTPEANVGRSIWQKKCKSRHLHIFLVGNVTMKPADSGVSESCTICHRIQHQRDRTGISLSLRDFLPRVLFEIPVSQLRKRRHLIFFRQDVINVRIGHHRKDQVIDLIERTLLKGQISSPPEIILNIGHLRVLLHQISPVCVPASEVIACCFPSIDIT